MLSISLLQPSQVAPPSPQPSSFISSLHSQSQVSLFLHRAVCFDPRRRHRIRSLRITNIDAAQPYDHESKLSQIHTTNTTRIPDNSIPESFPKLKIGILGFGNFGQFLAKTLIRQGHTVLAFSRSDYSEPASKLGSSFFLDPHDFCEEHPEVILLCTSILSTPSVLKTLPLQRFKRSTLFVDVLSVKEFPRSLFLQTLPRDFDILCTHPMFGPESGKNGWDGLPFVYDKVRVGKSEARVKRCDNFIDVFRREGCRMVEMSCAEHDKLAGSQFLTHLMGRVLQKLELESTPINTKGYESLLNLVDNTSKDSFELFYGLFLYNKNAMDELQRVDMAFEEVKKQLFGRLHGLYRDQLFEGSSSLNGNVAEKKDAPKQGSLQAIDGENFNRT